MRSVPRRGSVGVGLISKVNELRLIEAKPTLPRVGTDLSHGVQTMKGHKLSSIFLSATLTTALLITFAACSSQRRTRVEAPPSYQPTPETPQLKLPEVSAPKVAEVKDAVKRVFKDLAVVDQQQTPNFICGDFNGDASRDLAVMIKPAGGKVAEINEELQPWLLRDPLAPQSNHRVRLQIGSDEVLLAVIHGYGPNDWRDPEATQAFLLKNVAGSRLEAQTPQDFVSANTGRKLPRPRGDLISEVVGGAAGYLYFSGSTYSWYDPKTYKGEAPPGMVHGFRSLRK